MPERDACGVGALVRLDGRADTDILARALDALDRFEHRGGVVDQTGDGAGVLIQIDRDFVLDAVPDAARPDDDVAIGVGCLFVPTGERANDRELLPDVRLVLRRFGFDLLAWRPVPTRPEVLGVQSREMVPDVVHLIFGVRPHGNPVPRRLFEARLALEQEFPRIYVASMSTEVLVYKALATAEQFRAFYPDLQAGLQSSFALFHRRFSTNTISNWMLAQVFRFIAQNGEINSIRANRGAVKNLARALRFGNVLQQQGSDSADFDRSLELFWVHGMAFAEALRRMMPPARAEMLSAPEPFQQFLDASRRVMGPLGAFEGPAAIVATDGRSVVGVLDRMGLRPLRYCRTHSGLAYVGSEMGAVPFRFEDIAEARQLDPGEILEVELAGGAVHFNHDLHERLVTGTQLPIRRLATERVLPVSPRTVQPVDAELRDDLLARFGWDKAHLQTVRHMAKEGKEPITSMGFDRPLAVLQPGPVAIYDFFHQIIAVVTNPPVDPVREGAAMDLSIWLGRRPAVEGERAGAIPAQFALPSPVLSNAVAAGIHAGDAGAPAVRTVSLCVSADLDARTMERKLERRIQDAVDAVASGEADILWLTDRGAYTDGRVPLPVLLGVGGVHNELSGRGLRRHASLVAEVGDAAEGHDIAVLLAEGADAVCPWLLFDAAGEGRPGTDDAVAAVQGALDRSLLRIMSKMGITSIEGYVGSKLFEAVGVSEEIVDRYLRRTPTRIGGVDFQELHRALVQRARRTRADLKAHDLKPAYRKEVTEALQIVARGDTPGAYARYLELVRATPPTYLRDLLEFRLCVQPLALSEVSDEHEIIRSTFRGAAMSFGALSTEAHKAIAAAFNEMGAASNSGEGGEDNRRGFGGPLEPYRSRIRQVASARFGVDAEYLTNADEIEIKIGQGAKPGEGGHLPAHKVTAEIARIRKTKEGVALISPPPHHDIYSIEDLAQLIESLRQTHPEARIAVKCPATTDIGTIAVGVAKAGADVIAISGFEGGTGAAAKSSIEHAGIPLERGLSEVHHALRAQGVRDRVHLRADGGIKTGLDVAKLLALGADTVSFGTMLMVAEQCIYCRGCMAGKCPTGITTHDPKYKSRFLANVLSREAAAAERIVEAAKGVRMVMEAVAGELRALLAALGLQRPEDLVGRSDLLVQRRAGTRKLDTVNLAAFLQDVVPPPEPLAPVSAPLRDRSVSVLNERVLEAAAPALADSDEAVVFEAPIENTDRATGATLAGRLARVYQAERFAGTPRRVRDITLRLAGYAGQGLGFAAIDGMHIELTGFANDTVGEVMGEGARIVVRPPAGLPDTHLIGNAACYGASGGVLYVAGGAGQRLGVRNSGATIVAHRAGKYPFEYMTGGVGVLLGASGPVIGSGMTGGALFVYDERDDLERRIHSDVACTALSAADVDALHGLLEDFAAATGSQRAGDMLGDWETARARFRRVAPVTDVAVAEPGLRLVR